MSKLGTRDRDYLESRLLAPAEGAVDALVRLRRLGLTAEADRLLAAITALNEVARAIRREVIYETRP